MADITRRIGLSLGADLCWPICYEAVLQQLDLELRIGGDSIRFDTDRVTIEPFDLRQGTNYDVVIDRLTHWYTTSREWIKKAVLLNDLYVFNNPWAIQSMEKHTSYCAMMRLGMPIPDTWIVPPKAYEPKPDLQVTLERYARLFDLDEVGEAVGYPLFAKPFDGGGWVGVSRVDDGGDLRRAYDASGTHLLHLQRAVEPHDLFVRCIGLGPQTRLVRYEPAAPLHDRYTMDGGHLPDDQRQTLIDTTLTINAFFGWEFNSCEALRQNGTFYPIDFANACPDFQVTSLHYHFPEMVKRMIRWSLFCAYTKRPMRQNMHWEPFYEVAKKDLPYRDRLREYAAIARERMEADRFAEFCRTHLSHLNEVALEFFRTGEAKDIVRAKVAALYPAHEVETFTDHFFGLIQFWCKTEADRLAGTKEASA